MTCPWCSYVGTPRALHAHLGDAHPDGVRFEGHGMRQRYAVTCPYCDAGYEQLIKPGLDDPEFLEEYRREIRLVAFDMLVNHFLVEHADVGDEPPPVPSVRDHESRGGIP